MEAPVTQKIPSVASLVFVIKLEGEFDLADRHRLSDAFSLPRSASVVVVDFKRVSYIDSSVIDALLELRRRTLEREANLVLVGLDPKVKRIIEVCKLDDVFDIRPAFADLAGGLDQASVEIRTLTLVSSAE